MEPNEIDLIQKFKGGDQSVFEEFVVKYQHRIYTLCLYMLGNAQDAEDAAQETFIKAYRKLESFKPDVHLYTWLYRIGINTCLDHKHRLSSRKQQLHVDFDSLAQEIPSGLSPELQLQSRERVEALHFALTTLPAKLRSIIVLNEVEGLSYEEIHQVLNISMGTVKSRISRAREELRKKLRNKI